MSQRRDSEGDAALQRATRLAKKLFGEDHTFTASILEEHSRLMLQSGRKKEAKEMRRAAQSILDRQLQIRRNTVDISELGRP